MKRAGLLAMLSLGMVVVWLTPQACSAEAKCPWLNAATAAGLLGGDVQMTVSAATPGPAEAATDNAASKGMYSDSVRMDRFDVSCEFSRKADDGVDMLRIVVKTMSDHPKEFAGYLAQCGGETKALKAIGNEAVQCMVAGSAGGDEKVIGRVRDRAFVITVSRTGLKLLAAGADPLRDDTRNIAEQVAGSLF